jgi:hypothetical protein
MHMNTHSLLPHSKQVCLGILPTEQVMLICERLDSMLVLIRFYRFVVDPISPSRTNPFGEYDYEIMSRTVAL